MIFTWDNARAVALKIRRTIDKLWAKQAFRALLILVGLFFVGGIGFYTLERDAFQDATGRELEFADAFWWSVVTMSTVGYGDMVPVTMAGRAFGIMVVLAGLGSVGLFAGIASSFFSQIGQKEEDIRKARSAVGHLLICGYNNNVKFFLQGLDTRTRTVVLISDAKRPEDLPPGVIFLRGNPAEDEVLARANIKRARVAVVVLEDDSNALLTVLAVKALNHDLPVICNFKNYDNLMNFERVGTDSIFSSQSLCGEELARIFYTAISEEGVDYDSRIIICGWNNRTSFLLSLLDPTLFKYILINKTPITSEEIPPEIDVIIGEPWNEAILQQAGVKQCQIAVVALDDDSETLSTVLTIESKKKAIISICDLRQTRNIIHLKRVGADHVFSEEQLCAEELLHFVRINYSYYLRASKPAS